MENPFSVGAEGTGGEGAEGAVYAVIDVGVVTPEGLRAVTRRRYAVPGGTPTTVAELDEIPLSSTDAPRIGFPELSTTAYSYKVAPVPEGQRKVPPFELGWLVTEPEDTGTGVVYTVRGAEGASMLFGPTAVTTRICGTPGVRPVKTRFPPDTVGVTLTPFTK
jgi:hypothetical protein